MCCQSAGGSESGGVQLHFILSLPPVQLLLAIALFVVVGAGAAMLLLFGLRRAFRTSSMAVPVATFISAVATAWALALGFAAADVWTLRADADKAAFAERSSVMRLVGMADAQALDIPELREAVIDYVDLVTTVEWGADLNRRPHREVDEALQAIRLAIIDLAYGEAPQALVDKAVNDFDELQDARNARLGVGESVVDEAKWYLVVILTAMSMVTIATCHLDRPTAGFNALWIYGVVVAASLWVLGIHINPYTHLAIPFEVIDTV